MTVFSTSWSGRGDAPGTGPCCGSRPRPATCRWYRVTTIPATRTPARLSLTGDVMRPGGSHAVTLDGEVPLGGERFTAYIIPEPVAFAAMTFADLLGERGIHAKARLSAATGLPTGYDTLGNLLAEYVSPPLADQVKPMMKLSSNPHTVTFPYLVGAIAGMDPDNPEQAGDQIRHDFLTRAGLDPVPSGHLENRYTADYFVHFLNFIARQPYFAHYRDALPIMGKDGTLHDIQVHSPAAGHVYAKTGHGGVGSGNAALSSHAALAGYVQTRRSQPVSFALFADLAGNPDSANMLPLTSEALGEIATAVYLTVNRG